MGVKILSMTISEEFNKVLDPSIDTLVDLSVMVKDGVQTINALALGPCENELNSSCKQHKWCKTLKVLMCFEHCAGLFNRVLDEFNHSLIFSKGFGLLDPATQLYANKNGRATKLNPSYLLPQSMIEYFIDGVYNCCVNWIFLKLRR